MTTTLWAQPRPALCPPTCNSEAAQGGQREKEREKDDRALEQFEKCSHVKSHRGFQFRARPDPGSRPRAGLEMFYGNSQQGSLCGSPTSAGKCGVKSIKSTILSFRGLLHKAAPGKPMIICRCLLTNCSIRRWLWPLVMCRGSVSPRVGVDSGHGRGLFVVSTSQTKNLAGYYVLTILILFSQILAICLDTT